MNFIFHNENMPVQIKEIPQSCPDKKGCKDPKEYFTKLMVNNFLRPWNVNITNNNQRKPRHFQRSKTKGRGNYSRGCGEC